MLVGTMMASEVPTQSSVSTLSDPPRMPNPPNRAGTTTAPPPMPNRPASSPVTTPPTRIPIARSAISPGGTPNMGASPWLEGSCGRGPGRNLVAHERERIEECLRAGARLDTLGGKVAAKQPRAGDGVEQPDRVARDGVEPGAARDFALDVGNERVRRLPRKVMWCRRAKQLRIDRQQLPRILVGGASHHDAVDVAQV